MIPDYLENWTHFRAEVTPIGVDDGTYDVFIFFHGDSPEGPFEWRALHARTFEDVTDEIMETDEDIEPLILEYLDDNANDVAPDDHY